MADIRRAGNEGWNTEVIGADGDLERPDLVDDIAVEADRVRRAGKEVHVLALHDECGHIVGDDGHVEAHIMADRGREARSLKIRPRLRAEQAEGLPGLPRLLQHHADDRFTEALRHDRAAVWDERHEIPCNLIYLAVAAVVGVYGVLPDGKIDGPRLAERQLRRLQTAVTDQLHPLVRGRTRVRNSFVRRLQKAQLLLRRFFPALIRGQRHAHGRRRIRPRALRDHVADGLHDLHVRFAADKLDFRRIDPAVENPHLARIVPRNVFILQHEGQPFIGPELCHTSISSRIFSR